MAATLKDLKSQLKAEERRRIAAIKPRQHSEVGKILAQNIARNYSFPTDETLPEVASRKSGE